MKLKVANPNGIPKGVHILTTPDGRQWMEGEDFVGDLTPKQIKGLRDKGVLIDG